MRIAFSILGTEVLALEVGDPVEFVLDPGTIASQVEQAAPVRLGFQIDAIPSLEED